MTIDPTNPNYDIINKIFENAGNSRQTGIQLILEQCIGKRWDASGSVNFFNNRIDAYETTLLFPIERPFSIAASTDDT